MSDIYWLVIKAICYLLNLVIQASVVCCVKQHFLMHSHSGRVYSVNVKAYQRGVYLE